MNHSDWYFIIGCSAFGLAILGIVLFTISDYKPLTNEEVIELNSTQNKLQQAFVNAYMRDDAMLKEVNESKSCDIMKLKLEKFNDYFIDVNKRFLMFDNYELRCLK